MNAPRFVTLLALRLRLIAARVGDVPPWQVALFAIGWAISLTSAVTLLPIMVPAFRDLDEGLIIGTLATTLAAFSVVGVHLLVAEGSEPMRARQKLDPMDLLPVPATWSFYLSVIDETLSDPAALLIIPATILGIVIGSRTRWIALALSLVIAPLLMAVLAAVRISATHAARAIIPPAVSRLCVRGITYTALLVTVTVGGIFVYDVLAFARHTSEGLEPLALMSSTVALGLHEAFVAHPALARLLPPAWPVLALTGGPGWPLFALLTVLSCGLALIAMAQVHGRYLAHPALERVVAAATDHPGVLARVLSLWMPLGAPTAVALEAEVAAHRGLISEALVEGGLLLGSLFLLLTLAPQMYGSSFVDGFRFLGGLLTLLLTTPASAIAREGAGVTLRLSLPARQDELLLAKVPVIALRNVLLIVPSALALAFILPPAPPARVAAAAVLFALIALVGALAAVGSGMVVAPLVESVSSFGRQVVALALCGLTLSPLTLLAPSVQPYHAAAGVMACGLMVAGLWQKSLVRLSMLASPPADRAPSGLLGDAALGALLYVLGGSTLATSLSGAFPVLDHDRAMLASTLLLQILVIRYSFAYLSLREARTGEKPALSGTGRQWATGALLGVCGGLIALLYGWFLSEVLDIDARSGGGPLARMVGEIRDYPLEATLSLLAAGALAPLAEELLFRRLIFVGLWQASGRLASSAVISGLFFAIVHPPAGFPLILAVGATSALLWSRYRTLAACVGFHMAFNSLQLAALLVIGR